MTLNDAANYWRDRLEAGKPIYRVRVRRLLEIAGAERRGMVIMNRIRNVLDENGLEAIPDIESSWIDGFVRISLKGQNGSASEAELEPDLAQGDKSEPPEVRDPAVDPCANGTYIEGAETASVAESLNSPVGSLGLVETSIVPPMDPVARISSIPAANRGVMSVLLTDSIATAATCMMFEGYSQLAIMQGEREAFQIWFLQRTKFAAHELDLVVEEKWHQRWYKDPISGKESETDVLLGL